MTTILTDDQIHELMATPSFSYDLARAVEQAVLQSPEVRAWKKDAECKNSEERNSIRSYAEPD